MHNYAAYNYYNYTTHIGYHLKMWYDEVLLSVGLDSLHSSCTLILINQTINNMVDFSKEVLIRSYNNTNYFVTII